MSKEVGLKDGGHIYPSCSNCDAILMDIWRTRPHETEKWSIKANCPFCGDKSFIFEVSGGFHVAGYGEPKKEDTENCFESTSVDFPEIEGNVFKFNIKKAYPNAKPYKRR